MMSSSHVSGCSSDRRTGGGKVGTGNTSAATAGPPGGGGGNRRREREGGSGSSMKEVKEESEVLIIDLDHEAPTQLLYQNQTLSEESEVGRSSGARVTVTPFADCWNSLMEETKRKLMESVQRDHEAKTAEILEANKLLQEKIQQLESKVKELTLDNEELNLKVKEEHRRVESMQESCKTVFEQMRKIPGIMSGSEAVLRKFVKEGEGGAKESQQVPDNVPVTPTDTGATVLLAHVKAEIPDDETLEGQSEVNLNPLSTPNTGANNDPAPMTLGQVKEEVDQQPTGLSSAGFTTPTRSAVSYVRLLQQQATSSRRIKKRYSSRVCWWHMNKRNQKQGAPAKTSRSDRSMYALRPTPAKRRRLNISSRRPRPNFDPRPNVAPLAGLDPHPIVDQRPNPRVPGSSSRFASHEGKRLSFHKMDEARSASENGHYCTCGSALATQTSLKRHIRYFTDEWKFSCADCGQRFFSTNYMREHMIRYHDKVLPAGIAGCTRCGEIFQSYTEMNHHQKWGKCTEAAASE